MQVVSSVGGVICCSVGSSADGAHSTTLDEVAFLIQPDHIEFTPPCREYLRRPVGAALCLNGRPTVAVCNSPNGASERHHELKTEPSGTTRADTTVRSYFLRHILR
jgi:hypothetical protein